MEAAQGPVAFVTFSNEIFAARIPVRVRSENWNFGTDIMGRMQSTFAQNVCCHCRGCCFAVHSGDNDAALRAHDCSQSLRTAHDRLTRSAPAYENRIVVFNGGGKNNQLGGISLFRAMLLIKVQTEALQSICFHGGDLV